MHSCRASLHHAHCQPPAGLDGARERPTCVLSPANCPVHSVKTFLREVSPRLRGVQGHSRRHLTLHCPQTGPGWSQWCWVRHSANPRAIALASCKDFLEEALGRMPFLTLVLFPVGDNFQQLPVGHFLECIYKFRVVMFEALKNIC